MNLVGLTGKIVTELETKTIKVTDPKTKSVKNHNLTKFNIMITKSGREGGEVSNGFFEIEAWDNNADFAAKCFKRGMLISVKGILIQNRYKVDSKARSQVIIRAESFNFVPVVSEAEDKETISV
jgi:single-stranded DNA-binding protein